MMSRRGFFPAIALIVGVALLGTAFFLVRAHATAVTHDAPVYVHMNGANEFLESVVAVRPGQPVIFVNEDTGMHTIVGFNPATGHTPAYGINGVVQGTPGPGHPVSTYRVSFAKPGFYAYYCSVHAKLLPTFGKGVTAVKRAHADGYAAMSGVIVVTTDPALPAGNPATSRRRILPGYFGG
ncbi:MAG: cupredoxin domain-containing protein [Vulcanimicrobiaceae bacterium]